MSAFLKPYLARLQALGQRYFTHLSGQALAWYSVATHDLSKWEAGAAAAGTLVLTSFVSRVKAWLGTPAAK